MNLEVSAGQFVRYIRAVVLLAIVVAGVAPVAHGQSTQRDIVLMLDNSGSMRKNDPDFLTSVAVRAFINGLGEGYHVAIISFDQHVSVLQPLAALDAAHRSELLGSLDSINYRGLLTNSPAALERSIYELRTNGRAGAEKSIIFMTDGIVDVAPEGADDGDVEKARWMKSTLADEAADSAVRIFGIAFTDNADFELIQTLAKRTGGEYYRAYRAADIDGVFTSIRDQLSSSAPVTTPAPAVNRFLPEPGSATTSAGASPGAAALATGTQAPQTQAATETGTSGLGTGGSTLPATDPPLPVTGSTDLPPDSSRPESSLPASSLPASSLPEISLPEGQLPTVNLPVVSLGGDDSPPDAAATAEKTPETASAPPTDTSTQTTGANDTTTATAGDSLTQSSNDTKTQAPSTQQHMPAAMDDSKFYLALMVGATAILLALAALVFVVIRRKPAATPLTDPLMPKAFLNDLNGSTEKQSYEVGAKPIVVGRIKGADTEAADYIVIDESTIGRRHALIEYKEHSFWVTDQNSLNGTFVNNTRLETGVRLKHGDRIRFHKHEFEFLVLDMFETDRTMMSETEFADISTNDDDDATVVRIEDNDDDPSSEDPTVRRQ